MGCELIRDTKKAVGETGRLAQARRHGEDFVHFWNLGMQAHQAYDDPGQDRAYRRAERCGKAADGQMAAVDPHVVLGSLSNTDLFIQLALLNNVELFWWNSPFGGIVTVCALLCFIEPMLGESRARCVYT